MDMMGSLLRAANRLGIVAKAEPSVPAAALMQAAGSSPKYTDASWENYAKYGYQANSVVYRCIQAIVQNFAAAPLKCFTTSDNDPVPNHPAELIFKRPSQMMTGFRFWETYWIHWFISGNVMLYKARLASTRGVKELWLLRPDRVKIVAGDSLIRQYIYTLNGVDYPIDPSDIIHDMAYNPTDDWFGQSPLLAGLREIDTDNEATDFVKSTLENRSVAPGIMLFLDESARLDKAMQDRFKETWQTNYSGENRGRVGLMQGVKDAKVVSLNMKDMMMPDLRSLDEARICSLFGVPPIIAGVKAGLDRSTFSNFEEARKAFWEDTVEPLQNRVDDLMNAFLMPEFDNQTYCTFDNSSISALAPVQNSKIETAVKGLGSGLFTRNEARERVGLPVVEGGDIFLTGTAAADPGVDDVDVDRDDTLDVSGKHSCSHTHKATEKPVGSRSVGLVQGALGRIKTAEKWYDRMFALMDGVIKDQHAEYLKMAGVKSADGMERKDPPPLQSLDLTESQWQELMTIWTANAAQKFGSAMAEQITTAARMAAEEIGLSFNIDNHRLLKFIDNYTYKFAAKISETSAEGVRQVIRNGFESGIDFDEIITNLADKFGDWSSTRAEMVARTEVIRASNYGAKEAWRQAGVEEVQWLASDDACGYCIDLDGKVVGINENFFNVGDEFLPEGADAPLKINYEDIGAPPLHPQCRCTLLTVEE